MKAILCIASCFIAVIIGLAIVPIGMRASAQNNTVVSPPRLINLLAIDQIVSIRSWNSSGSYDIDIFDDDSVQSFRDNVERIKKEISLATKENHVSDLDDVSNRKRIEMIESGWLNLTIPWKVVRIGDDFVHLEPMTQLPQHEKVSWIAVSQTSIRQFKCKKD